MLNYKINPRLQRKLRGISKKNPVLAHILKRKIKEILSHSKDTIKTYKNLKKPLHKFQRIHSAKNNILLFYVEDTTVYFMDIAHIDKAYD